jgi:oligopeptide/dipeptide ABC transporter ATP-binding protein
LLASLPDAAAAHLPHRRLAVIPGQVVDPRRPPPGCRFEPRCARAAEICRTKPPDITAAGATQLVRCVRWNEP